MAGHEQKNKPGKKDDAEDARRQDAFNKMARVYDPAYAAGLLMGRDLSVLFMEGKFDGMRKGLERLSADPSPQSMGNICVRELTAAIARGWFPDADDDYPADGFVKRDALRRDFAQWLATGGGKGLTAVAGALLDDMTVKLEGNLYKSNKDDKETLFALLKATGAPLLDRKLAEARQQIKIARQNPDQEIRDDSGAIRSIVPGGNLALAKTRLDNLASLKEDYDTQAPPRRKHGPGPKP